MQHKPLGTLKSAPVQGWALEKGHTSGAEVETGTRPSTAHGRETGLRPWEPQTQPSAREEPSN